MYQKDDAIVWRTNISTDALVINQTDHEERICRRSADGLQAVRLFHTTQRGLSNSRNMALANASGDICLLCDDDEILSNDYAQTICRAFEELFDADVIAFDVTNKTTRLKKKVQRVGRLRCLRLASCQLALKRTSILEQRVMFDPLMGSGSGNGSCEETKFLLDCIGRGLRIYYVPQTIGQICPSPSIWFSGYDETFFYQRGGATRHMLGLLPSVFYGIYYLTAKRGEYHSSITCGKAARELFRGILENPIRKQM